MSSLGDAKSSLGDAKSSLGDVKSSLGDAKSSLGGVKSSWVTQVSHLEHLGRVREQENARLQEKIQELYVRSSSTSDEQQAAELRGVQRARDQAVQRVSQLEHLGRVKEQENTRLQERLEVRACVRLVGRGGHVRRTLVPPPLRRDVKLGWSALLRARVSTPSAPPTRLQPGHCLPCGMIHRVDRRPSPPTPAHSADTTPTGKRAWHVWGCVSDRRRTRRAAPGLSARSRRLSCVAPPPRRTGWRGSWRPSRWWAAPRTTRWRGSRPR